MARQAGRCEPVWRDLLHATCVLVALQAPVSADEVNDETELEPWDAYEAAVRLLRDGDPDQRRLAAEAALESLFDVDSDEEPETARRVEEELWWLWETLHADPDDWHVTRFLRNLLFRDSPVVGEVFLDALASPSRNVRASAIARFAQRPDPRARARLESLWEDESRPWVQADLTEAFIELGSARYAADFLRLAHGEDGETALAAIRALAALRIEVAEQDLVELTGHPSSQAVAVEAIRALDRFPASVVALDAILEASRTERPRVRNAAFRALGTRSEPEASDRLLLAASREVDESSCDVIRSALMGWQGEPVTLALAGMLRWAVGAESRCIVGLIESLRQRDDPTALAEIQDLVTAVKPWGLAIRGLASYLARDRSAPPEPEAVVIACGGIEPVDPVDPTSRRVRLASPARSTRCWAAPAALDGVRYDLRIPEAALVRVTERFERHDELWVEVQVEGSWTCWVRDRDLERLAPDDELLADDAEPMSHAARDARAPERYEFDGSADELLSPGAVVLLEAGLLEIVEPGAPVVGLVYAIDDLEALALAQSICEAGGCGQILLDALEDRKTLLEYRRRAAAD